MSIAVVAKNAVRGIQHKSPVILTGFAVAGVVSTVVLASKATVKAVHTLDDLDDMAEVSSPTITEKVRAVWSYYIPTIITGASTIACVIGAQSINARRQAALVGAFTITENAFQEYKDRVVETLGKSKDKKIHDEMVQKQVTENPPPSDLMIIGSGNVLCLDTYTGRYFESTMEKIRGAQNDFNQGLLNGEMYMSLNEFYHILNLPDTVVGEQVGFSPENLLDIQFSTALTEDGRPCLAISFRALPRQDYFTFQ
jgi:hypothetical protein